jgi:hypothetical protein
VGDRRREVCHHRAHPAEVCPIWAPCLVAVGLGKDELDEQVDSASRSRSGHGGKLTGEAVRRHVLRASGHEIGHVAGGPRRRRCHPRAQELGVDGLEETPAGVVITSRRPRSSSPRTELGQALPSSLPAARSNLSTRRSPELAAPIATRQAIDTTRPASRTSCSLSSSSRSPTSAPRA